MIMWYKCTGQWILCFDRCQLTITWMSSIKEGCYKPSLFVSVILAGVWPPSCDTVIAVVLCTHPRMTIYLTSLLEYLKFIMSLSLFYFSSCHLKPLQKLCGEHIQQAQVQNGNQVIKALVLILWLTSPWFCILKGMKYELIISCVGWSALVYLLYIKLK